MSYITPAHQRFKVGQKVISTPLAIKNGVFDFHQSGVIVGFCYSPLCVRVKIDGRKSVQDYHIDFWKKVRNTAHDPD